MKTTSLLPTIVPISPIDANVIGAAIPNSELTRHRFRRNTVMNEANTTEVVKRYSVIIDQTTPQAQAIAIAVHAAIQEIGMAAVRRMSMFPSNSRK